MPSSSLLLKASVVISALCTAASATVYQIQDTYQGASFLEGFSFFEQPDPTNGFVNYLSKDAAANQRLTKMVGNEQYLGVDYTTPLLYRGSVGRGSIRIESNRKYNHGLFILDLKHMPGGICGTSPGFWSYNTELSGSRGGEIGIIEGVNINNINKFVLHTDTECSVNGLGQTGAQNSYNCALGSPSGASGCDVSAVAPNTFGTGFNANGGGVYAMEWTSTGIKTWFFSRGAIPTEILADTPDTARFGIPTANFQGSCNFDERFINQQFVFDTTFCGDGAGSVYDRSGCPRYAGISAGESCKKFVAENPSAFRNAYWQISYLKTYSTNVVSSSSSATPSATSSSAASSPTTIISSSAESSVASSSSSSQIISSSTTSSSSETPSATSSSATSSSTAIISFSAIISSSTSSSSVLSSSETSSTLLGTSSRISGSPSMPTISSAVLFPNITIPGIPSTSAPITSSSSSRVSVGTSIPILTSNSSVSVPILTSNSSVSVPTLASYSSLSIIVGTGTSPQISGSPSMPTGSLAVIFPNSTITSIFVPVTLSTSSPVSIVTATPTLTSSSSLSIIVGTEMSSQMSGSAPIVTLSSSSTTCFPNSTTSSTSGTMTTTPLIHGAATTVAIKPTLTTTYATTYIDICSTGFTTKTTTQTVTYCPTTTHSTAGKPTMTSVYVPPPGMTVTTTVCTVCAATPTTVTLTIPCPSTPVSSSISTKPVPDSAFTTAMRVSTVVACSTCVGGFSSTVMTRYTTVSNANVHVTPTSLSPSHASTSLETVSPPSSAMVSLSSSATVSLPSSVMVASPSLEIGSSPSSAMMSSPPLEMASSRSSIMVSAPSSVMVSKVSTIYMRPSSAPLSASESTSNSLSVCSGVDCPPAAPTRISSPSQNIPYPSFASSLPIQGNSSVAMNSGTATGSRPSMSSNYNIAYSTGGASSLQVGGGLAGVAALFAALL